MRIVEQSVANLVVGLILGVAVPYLNNLLQGNQQKNNKDNFCKSAEEEQLKV